MVECCLGIQREERRWTGSQVSCVIFGVKVLFLWIISCVVYACQVSEVYSEIDRLLSAIVIYLRFAFSIRAHFLPLDPPSCASSRLQKLLKHISIRRLKTDQDDGRPLVKLPPRTVVIQEVELSEEERTLYDSMQKHGQLIITGWDFLRHCLFRYLSGLGSYRV